LDVSRREAGSDLRKNHRGKSRKGHQSIFLPWGLSRGNGCFVKRRFFEQGRTVDQSEKEAICTQVSGRSGGVLNNWLLGVDPEGEAKTEGHGTEQGKKKGLECGG